MKNNINNLNTKRFFSEFAKNYEEEIHWKTKGTAYLSSIETNFVEKCLSKNKNHKGRCLEIGAGTGRFTKILLSKGFRVEVIECADGMVNKLRERFKNCDIDIKKIDAGRKFPYLSDYFDCVVAMRVLKYIPTWRESIREVYRILKGDGCFVFSIANKYSVAYFKGQAPYFLFRPKEVIRHLKGLGFDIIEITTTTRLPFPLYYKINSKGWLCLIIFVENILDKILPFWLLSRSVIICAKKQ